MDKKVAVICGAGILGRTVAVALAEAGMKIAVMDSDMARAQSVADVLPREAGSLAVAYNPLKEDTVITAVSGIGGRLGRIDALVNTDLEIARRLCNEITGETFGHVIERNARCYFFTARACASIMARGGGGRIVNISSVHSHVADGYHMEYAMATSAINALTREMADSYWKDNIQAVTVATCFVDGQFPEEMDMDQRQAPERISLLGRRITAWDVARTVRFFVTSKTKCFNGAEIRADAGYLTTQYRVGDVPFVKITD